MARHTPQPVFFTPATYCCLASAQTRAEQKTGQLCIRQCMLDKSTLTQNSQLKIQTGVRYLCEVCLLFPMFNANLPQTV